MVMVGDSPQTWALVANHTGCLLVGASLGLGPNRTPRSLAAVRPPFARVKMRARPGLTTVGQAEADVGLPAEAVTLATALKSPGYETGQFGKNHLRSCTRRPYYSEFRR